jgi:hypothetical protein
MSGQEREAGEAWQARKKQDSAIAHPVSAGPFFGDGFEAGYRAAFAVREELSYYDPDEDKRPYRELTRTQQIARERGSFKRQLEAVDRELQWKGSGRGRIESIRLLTAREEPQNPSEWQIEEAARLIYGGVGPVKVCPWERVDEPSKVKWLGIAQVVLRGALVPREDTERPDARLPGGDIYIKRGPEHEAFSLATNEAAEKFDERDEEMSWVWMSAKLFFARPLVRDTEQEHER